MDTYQLKNFRHQKTYRDVLPSHPLDIPLPACPGTWNLQFYLLVKNIKAYTVLSIDAAGNKHVLSVDPPWNQSEVELMVNSIVEIPAGHTGRVTIEFLVSDYNASIEIQEINGILIGVSSNAKKDCSCEIATLMNKGCQCGGT